MRVSEFSKSSQKFDLNQLIFFSNIFISKFNLPFKYNPKSTTIFFYLFLLSNKTKIQNYRSITRDKSFALDFAIMKTLLRWQQLKKSKNKIDEGSTRQ